MTRAEPLADVSFRGPIIEWRGPAPFYFVAMPSALAVELRHAARLASYGWGCVPVDAEVNGVAFTTSLFPRDGGYLVPLKAAMRRAAGVAPDDAVAIRLRVAAR